MTSFYKFEYNKDLHNLTFLSLHKDIYLGNVHIVLRPLTFDNDKFQGVEQKCAYH